MEKTTRGSLGECISRKKEKNRKKKKKKEGKKRRQQLEKARERI